MGARFRAATPAEATLRRSGLGYARPRWPSVLEWLSRERSPCDARQESPVERISLPRRGEHGLSQSRLLHPRGQHPAAGGYSVRDILWLRVLAVTSSLAAIPYFLLQPTPLWAAFGWSVLFTGINVFQAWRLLVERRPVKLTPEEEEVRRLVFRDLPPRKVLQLISIGSWVTAAAWRAIDRARQTGRIRVAHRSGKGAGDEGGTRSRRPGRGGNRRLRAAPGRPPGGRGWGDGGDHAHRPMGCRDAGAPSRADPETRNLFQRHLAKDLAGKSASGPL